MFYELCESPAMSIICLLRKMLFDAFLANLLGRKSEEEREMYTHGRATALASRSCKADPSDPESVLFYEVMEQVCREVEKNLDEIGP